MQYFEQRRNPLFTSTGFLNAPVKGNSSVLTPPPSLKGTVETMHLYLPIPLPQLGGTRFGQIFTTNIMGEIYNGGFE